MRKFRIIEIICIGISTLTLIACSKSQANKSNPQPDGKRVVVKVDLGPYIGVNEEALNELKAYRSASNPSSSTYHLGRPATDAEIAAWDINVTPDGNGLPEGSGTVSAGAALYASKCAACHGVNGEGIKPYYDALVRKESTGKTIGSFWPYATTVFDYIRRGMPFTIPGSLSDDEVYSLTAYLLYKNDLISEDTIINAESLPKVAMPNRDAFIPDERENYNYPH